MKVNGESIYGTTASPFSGRTPWGRCTVKAEGADSHLYVHVLSWPANGSLLLRGLQNEVASAQLLAGGAAVKVESSPHGPVLKLPATAPDAVCSTIKVRLKGQPKVVEMPVLADADGVIRLSPFDAKLQGDLKLGQRGGVDVVVDWANAVDVMSWSFEAADAGVYVLQLKTSAEKSGAALMVEGVGKKLACSIPKTENKRTFVTTPVGEVKLQKGQKLTLSLHPVVDGWSPVDMAMVELVPKR